MKKLLIIFYTLFSIQLLVDLYEYVTRNKRFFGFGDFLESFFTADKHIILVATLILYSILLLVVKEIRPTRKHKLAILFILGIELVKVLLHLLDTGSWSSWWL